MMAKIAMTNTSYQVWLKLKTQTRRKARERDPNIETGDTEMKKRDISTSGC